MSVMPSDALEMLRAASSHPIVRGFPEGAIVVFDGDLRYLCAGGQGLASVGLTQDDVAGKTIFEVFPAEVSSLLEEPYRRALLGQEVTMDIRFGGRTFLHRFAPLTDDRGDIVAGIGFALDVTAARRSEQALRDSEESLREEQRRLQDAEAIGNSGSWEWDTATNVITWSDGLFALHGLDPMSFTDGYDQAVSRVHPDDRPMVDSAMESCRRNEPVQMRYRIARVSDGQWRWFDSRVSGVFENHELVRLIGAVADITDQVVAEAEVIEANKFQEAVIAASPDYTFITSLQTGAFLYGSRDRDMLGHSNEEMKEIGANSIDLLVHPDDQAALRALNVEAGQLKDGQALQVRYRLRHVDGQWHWFSRHVVPFRRDDDGSVIEILGVLRDITDLVHAEEQLSHDALHDTLTGLPNRALLLDRMDAALTRSTREGREVAILFCDLDGFKHVNDTAGHAAGDAVLVETARRLRNSVRSGDTVARVGGDEFVLIIEPWNRSEQGDEPVEVRPSDDARPLAVSVAERMVRAIRQPITVHGVEHEISVSIGITYSSIAVAPDGNTVSASDMLGEADAAMYEAKHRGKNRFAVFARQTS